MASTTTTRLTPRADAEYGTFPIAANTRILKGIIVQLNASDQAIPGADGNGFPAVGRSQACYDNTTGSEAGGSAGDLDCEVDYGVFGWLGEAGHLPTVGDVCYVADNQTVSTDSDTGQRGIAGYCVEVRDSLYWIDMGPATAGQIVIAATEASQLDDLQAEVGDYTGGGGAQADIATGVTTAESNITALQTDATSAQCEVVVPLGSLRWNTGAAIAAFADNTTDGFELSGSECLGIRFNNDTAPRLTAAGEVHIPSDWDDTAAITLHVEGFRVGELDAAMVGTVTAFAQEVGDAYTADADAGGSTTAFDGATTVITDETLAFTAGVLPAGSKVSFTFTPDAALDGDDFVLTGLKFVGTRALRTS